MCTRYDQIMGCVIQDDSEGSDWPQIIQGVDISDIHIQS